METDKRKQLSVRVNEKIHKQMKLYAVEQGITIQEYLMNLIKKDMEKHRQKNEKGSINEERKNRNTTF